jgi:sugar-specific transcriptional regulator TrmB
MNMMSIKTEDLEAFGLTKYESKAYLTLLKRGKEQVKPLAQYSDVPIGRIYDILHSLEYKGLIIGDKGRPASYMARDPKVAISALLDSKAQELDDLRNQATEFERKLQKLREDDKRKTVVRDIAFEEEIMEKFLSKIRETQNALRIYYRADIQDKGYAIDEIKYYKSMFQELLDRGCTIQYLVGGITEKELVNNQTKYVPVFIGLKGAQVRVHPIIMQTVDIIDDSYVMLKVNDPTDQSHIFSLIYIEDEEFAQRMVTKFDELWEESIQIHLNEG